MFARSGSVGTLSQNLLKLFHAGQIKLQDELYEGLLLELIKLQYASQRMVNNVTGVRKATKIKLFKRLTVVLDYIESNFRDPITLEQVAAIAFLSVSYLKKSFKEVYGISLHQLIITRRLEYAEYLLKKEAIPVSEVGFQVGFQDVSSFIRAFGRKYKMSPLKLRQRE